MATFATEMALKKDARSKARCPDGIRCERDRSTFKCNLLFAGRYQLDPLLFKSQMVKINCLVNHTHYCM